MSNLPPASERIESLKRQICEIGSRIYQKGFAAANEGNLSVRLDDEHVLCTPTLHCKGFMEPADICTVDMNGQQVDGRLKRTSEVMLHLEIYRMRPDVDSVVHCHPPHATAFAVAREPIPTCVLPEPDIFLGEVPIAPYETPGGKAFAQTILPFVEESNVIVLANHGTVSFETGLEKAYWLTEILDAYCRILINAKHLGHVEYVSLRKGQELLQMRKDWGFDDSRDPAPDATCNIADFALFKSTWAESELKQVAFPKHPSASSGLPDQPPKLDETRSTLDTLETLETLMADAGQCASDQSESSQLSLEHLLDRLADKIAKRLQPR